MSPLREWFNGMSLSGRSISHPRGSAEGRRETASEESADSSGVVPGVVGDVRLNGDHATVEVRVPRDVGETYRQGTEIRLDGRPLWYLHGERSGMLQLRRRDDESREFLALFTNFEDGDRALAQRVCDLLNEHGGPTCD